MKAIIVSLLLIVGQFSLKAQGLSQPLLLYPINGDTIFETNPILNWVSAPPPNSFNVSYKLILVEILPGQSAIAAIQANPILASASSIQVQSYQYPLNAPTLGNHKQYAWQVKLTYYLGNSEQATLYSESSEVSTFTYSNIFPAELCMPLISTLTSKDEFLLVEKKKLYFTIDSVHISDIPALKFYIINTKGEEVANDVFPVSISQNIYHLDLNQFKEFRTKKNQRKFYKLVATGLANRKYALKFTYE